VEKECTKTAVVAKEAARAATIRRFICIEKEGKTAHDLGSLSLGAFALAPNADHRPNQSHSSHQPSSSWKDNRTDDNNNSATG
jgi:hypothetical protein